MSLNTKPAKEFYTEDEAASALGISRSRLRMLLDQNLFNDGSQRPEDISFRYGDLVLISFWNKTSPNPKVVRMPRRA
jgi:hypothetical protein